MQKIFWFTGQAGAGKTELANALKARINGEQKIIIIDGDDIRELYNNTDYSITGRKENVAFVQKLCTFLIKNEVVPIVCMVSPFSEQRRVFIEQYGGVEIYVQCNEIRGRENYHVDYYEKPKQSTKVIEVDTTNKSVTKSFEELWKKLL